MKRVLLVILAVAMGLSSLSAASCDSTAVTPEWLSVVSTGATATVAGLASRPLAVEAPAFTGKEASLTLPDIVQYTPLALPWAVKACGGATRSGWGRMAFSQAAGIGLMCASVYTVKHSVTERRPDGSDDRSFPSGHAAWAFIGATYASHELAWRSPWYGVGSFSVASAIAIERVIERRHYPADVMAGAGIGILSAQIGYLVGDLVFGTRGYDSHYRRPEARIGSSAWLSSKTGMMFSLNHVCIDGLRIRRQPSLYSGLEGGVAFGNGWELSGEALVTATPIFFDVDPVTLRPLTSVSCLLMPGYSHAFGSRFMLSGRIGAGYMARFRLHWPTRALSAGSGSAVAAVSLQATMALTDRFACALEGAYRLSRYNFTLGESSTAGADQSINIGLITRLSF